MTSRWWNNGSVPSLHFFFARDRCFWYYNHMIPPPGGGSQTALRVANSAHWVTPLAEGPAFGTSTVLHRMRCEPHPPRYRFRDRQRPAQGLVSIRTARNGPLNLPEFSQFFLSDTYSTETCTGSLSQITL